MPTAAHCCVLCGVARAKGQRSFRAVSAEYAHQVVRARCVPTAFHYESVLAIPKEQRCAVCPACLNWKRASRRGVRAHRKKSCTPLDRSATPSKSAFRQPRPAKVPFG